MGNDLQLPKHCLATLCDVFERGLATIDEVKAAFDAWEEEFTRYRGQVLSRESIIANITAFAMQYLDRETSIEPSKILFVMYTFYALVLKLLATRLLPGWTGIDIATPDTMKETMRAIENGNYFEETLNIINFPADKYFSWYLHVFDGTMNAMIASVMNLVTRIIDNASSAFHDTFVDLPARIYQSLVPKQIRHDLGEVYTPPWLAQLVIDEVGFTGSSEQKILDPGCGTGTFLVAVIRKITEQNQEQDKERLLSAMMENVVGFDVNSVSILAAKVNYMLAISCFLVSRSRASITLPVHVRDAMIDDGDAKDVDFIVGNPPWIKWDFLPRDYKERLGEQLLREYVLYSYKGMKSGLGFAHDDISITFTYLCMDKFLKHGGILGFVLKQTLYKGIAGKEFRKFAIERRDASVPLQMLAVHDLRALKAFKSSAGADVEASIAILKKGTPTTYPVPYIMWKPAPRSRIDDGMTLDEVTAAVVKEPLDAVPDPSLDDVMAPWVLVKQGETPIAIPRGKNAYVARHGVVNDLNSVFFITITGASNDLVLIQNQQTGRKKVKQVSAAIEPALIYPVLKPRHVKRWQVNGHYTMIVPHDQHGQIAEEDLLASFPKTYEYLLSFKDDLHGRSSRWFKGAGVPFYALFGIGEYTFKPYKVVWSSIGALHAFAVARPITDGFFGTKPAIPDNTIGFCSLDAEAEAHYTCAVLNSSAVDAVLSVRSTGSKWGTSIAMINEIPIPPFDPRDPVHDALSKLSLQAHAITARNDSTDDVQREIDELAASLFLPRSA